MTHSSLHVGFQRKHYLSTAPQHPSSSLKPDSPSSKTQKSRWSSNFARRQVSPTVQVRPIAQLIHRALPPQLHLSRSWHIPAVCLRLTHTAGCCTPTQCHAVKLTTLFTPNSESILFVSQRWEALGFKVSGFSEDRSCNNYETYRNFHRCPNWKICLKYIYCTGTALMYSISIPNVSVVPKMTTGTCTSQFRGAYCTVISLHLYCSMSYILPGRFLLQ